MPLIIFVVDSLIILTAIAVLTPIALWLLLRVVEAFVEMTASVIRPLYRAALAARAFLIAFRARAAVGLTPR